MRILVSNDDGIDSEGLHVLARAMTEHGEVTVVAPDREYSGASASLGVLGEMHPEVRRIDSEGAGMGGVAGCWTVAGPPALCVLFASIGMFGPPFDLVVMGVNPGINVGRAVYHSGTVGGALTARARGWTAVAVSQAVEGYGVEGQGWDSMLRDQRWEGAVEVASAVVGGLVEAGLGAPVVLNVNVPNLQVKEMSGWQRTTIGRIPPRVIAEASLEEKPGHPGSYKVSMRWGDAVSLPEGTDGGAVERDRVSITFLGMIAHVNPAPDVSAEAAAEQVVAAALDRLFESTR